MTTVVAQSSASSSILRGKNPTSISNSFSDDGLNQNIHPHPGIANPHYTLPPHSLASVALGPSDENSSETDSEEEEERFRKWRRKRGKVRQQQEEGDNWSTLALFLTALRKSLVWCYNDKSQAECSTSDSSSSYSSSSPTSSSSSWNKMEIGVPMNVRHVAHVTFDRFNGFLGLPVEFEPEVPRRAPSASAKVFGVSTNSMQLSFDSRGNSVPTILLMMQHRLYALGGLEAEGIFRINAGNDQEEYVRDQLNQGVVPVDADVHCLAGLIKAWFRELPSGLLDSLSPEHLMMSQTEEECAELARHLSPTEASLLDWAVNLMADIVQHENLNKMNARNVAVVFAPNMTHVMDPLTALMHAVQVMNFLKNLISRTLREREDSILDAPARSSRDRFDESGPQTPLQTIFEENSEGIDEDNYNNDDDNNNNKKPCSPIIHHHDQDDHSDSALKGEEDPTTFLNSIENNSILQRDFDQSASAVKYSDGPTAGGGGEPSTTTTTRASSSSGSGSGSCEGAKKSSDYKKTSNGLSVKWALDKAQRKGSNGSGRMKHQSVPMGKATKGTNVVSRVNSRAERVEAWR